MGLFRRKAETLEGTADEYDDGGPSYVKRRIRRARLEWLVPGIDHSPYDAEYGRGQRGWEVGSGEGNCYVSKTHIPDKEAGPGHFMHMPCIDLDFDCELYESRTRGHYHLYLNKEVPWDRYVTLLKALQGCGLVQRGWVEQSIREGHTTLRKPPILEEFRSLQNRADELNLD